MQRAGGVRQERECAEKCVGMAPQARSVEDAVRPVCVFDSVINVCDNVVNDVVCETRCVTDGSRTGFGRAL